MGFHHVPVKCSCVSKRRTLWKALTEVYSNINMFKGVSGKDIGVISTP